MFCAFVLESGSVEPRASRVSSSEPMPSIFLRISSRPPSLARVLVVTGVLGGISAGGACFPCCNLVTAAPRTRLCPTVSPKSSMSFAVSSLRESSLSRSSFLSASTVASFKASFSDQAFYKGVKGCGLACGSSLELQVAMNICTWRSAHIYAGLVWHFRYPYLILINRFITHHLYKKYLKRFCLSVKDL